MFAVAELNGDSNDRKTWAALNRGRRSAVFAERTGCRKFCYPLRFLAAAVFFLSSDGQLQRKT
ncbi:hypothetical protein HOLDEFILI_01403 [Holdemania filiformis DSM 12042]|uniref:Uncharacterized protein n=1 Tax=Holdemania filiformis DSM 12042 TaxID=545696 RepID=B9Y6H1_9FIRM|nr:hypothetical protein HOLDEFILI_01403 [Holdemania filiformis DSM 12042]